MVTTKKRNPLMVHGVRTCPTCLVGPRRGDPVPSAQSTRTPEPAFMTQDAAQLAYKPGRKPCGANLWCSWKTPRPLLLWNTRGHTRTQQQIPGRPPWQTPSLNHGQNGMSGPRWPKKRPGAITTGTQPCRHAAKTTWFPPRPTADAACMRHSMRTTEMPAGGIPFATARDDP